MHTEKALISMLQLSLKLILNLSLKLNLDLSGCHCTRLTKLSATYSTVFSATPQLIST